jgi:5-hydroxyisourate hydrolase
MGSSSAPSASISTHVLDLRTGRPASGLPVRLERCENGSNSSWISIAQEKTNSDGRIAFSHGLQKGTYRLTFHVSEYLQAASEASGGESPFYSEIPVVFEVSDPSRKLHVPLLLSPYGYSTYRGS